MKITSRHKALLLDLVFFLLLGGFFWTISFLGQSSFPGSNVSPFLIRSIIQAGLLIICYSANIKFIRKNTLNDNLLKLRAVSIPKYLTGSVLGCLLIFTMWTIIYLVYPFDLTKNSISNVNIITDLISYSLGNTLEELLFRGFLLMGCIKLFGKITGVLLISLLFGLFHLQGTGLTKEGLSMVMTTFTMSLLFISVIFYTNSIWTAVTLHVTGNILLHTLGFDGTSNGIFQIRFATPDLNRYLISAIFEIVVIAYALLIFSRTKKQT